MAPVRERLVWCGRAARLVLEDPREGLDRALLRVVRRRHQPGDDVGEPESAWGRHLHLLLGAAWPCLACLGFADVFSDALDLLQAHGLAVGRGTFGGWDDADPAFAQAVWCLTVHLRPRSVVETGVARGVTTRVILEALQQQRSGHLWSIDRPPLDSNLHREIGAAVPAALRTRWTLLRGTSRRVLPGLLREIAPIDLFVHDSLHSERNLRFELTRAWSAMDGAGALAADDVDRNTAFARFVERTPDLDAFVGQAGDGRNCFGVAVATKRAEAAAA